MKFISILIWCLLFFQFGNSQNSVFIKSTENGNGILQQRYGECYVITPQHVVKSGDAIIIDENRYESKAELKEVFQPDLALLKAENSGGLACLDWQPQGIISSIISSAVTGVVEYRDELGIINLIHVDISSSNQEYIIITPKNPDEQFKKGNSGSVFYIIHQGKKLVAGMLMSIDKDLKYANVYQIDDIERNLSNFFFKNLSKKRIGFFIIEKENNQYSRLNGELNNSLGKVKRYSPVSHIPQNTFLETNLQSILKGQEIDLPDKMLESIDEILMGELDFKLSQVASNQFMVKAILESKLFSTNEFGLKNSFRIQASGIGRDPEAAQQAAIKELSKKISLVLSK